MTTEEARKLAEKIEDDLRSLVSFFDSESENKQMSPFFKDDLSELKIQLDIFGEACDDMLVEIARARNEV